MNQKVLSGLTATLLMTTLGMPLAGNADQTKTVSPGAEADRNQASTQPTPAEVTPINAAVKDGEQQTQSSSPTSEVIAVNQPSTPALQLTHAVVKLGEQQSQASATSTEEAIAKVQAHNLAGRRAAILYVRNIPILTLTGSKRTATETVKMGSQQLTGTIATNKSLSSPNAATDSAAAPETSPRVADASSRTDIAVSQSDPVLRAAAIAAQINRLNQEGVDAKTITVSWNTQADKAGARGEGYAIKANKTLIAIVDANTVLPDTTRNLEKDALQATNRLRRVLGNASPLNSISGKPNSWSQQVAVGSIRFKLSGLASWYGPGFHGSPSASGERFNENAMTAAHRTLPFGTQVLVTNLDTGRSVVVRINDRGPYSGNRIIDLSTAAARVLGLIQTGVAPVRLDILDNIPRAITAAGN